MFPVARAPAAVRMVVSGDVDAVTAVELQHAAIDVLRCNGRHVPKSETSPGRHAAEFAQSRLTATTTAASTASPAYGHPGTAPRPDAIRRRNDVCGVNVITIGDRPGSICSSPALREVSAVAGPNANRSH